MRQKPGSRTRSNPRWRNWLVIRAAGPPSVSEAAALLGAGAGTEPGAGAAATALLLEKHKLKGGDGRNATVSVARCDVRHRRQPP